MLSASIGTGLANKFTDVRSIQLLLELAARGNPALTAVDADGYWGTQTRNALMDFQRVVMKMTTPTGVVAPADATEAALAAAIPAGVLPEKVHGAVVNAEPTDVTVYFSPLQTTFAKYQIGSSLRIAHFLAQVGQESGDLRYHEEIASGQAYEGRADLGNTQHGDGPRFKGRGLIQLTGRANYQAYGNFIGIDLTQGGNWEKVAEDPLLAADVAGWFWDRHGLNALADRDDVIQITRRINGGETGLDARTARLQRAKFFWRP